MGRMRVERLKGGADDRRTEVLSDWMRAAGKMRVELWENWEFDPLRFNETAMVGFLVAAAGRAGLLAFPEYAESDRRLPEGRVRAGRCDLWLATPDGEMSEVIEFKLCWFGPRGRKGLLRPLNAAIDDVCKRDPREAPGRLAAAVYCPWSQNGLENCHSWKAHANIRALASHVDFAFAIPGGECTTYFLFKSVSTSVRVSERHHVYLSEHDWPEYIDDSDDQIEISRN